LILNDLDRKVLHPKELRTIFGPNFTLWLTFASISLSSRKPTASAGLRVKADHGTIVRQSEEIIGKLARENNRHGISGMGGGGRTGRLDRVAEMTSGRVFGDEKPT
jgi:hypothetical protein